MPPKITSRVTCSHGHDWIESNIYTTPYGQKVCRVCQRQYQRRYREMLRTFEQKTKNAIQKIRILHEDQIKDFENKIASGEKISTIDFKNFIDNLCN